MDLLVLNLPIALFTKTVRPLTLVFAKKILDKKFKADHMLKMDFFHKTQGL